MPFIYSAFDYTSAVFKKWALNFVFKVLFMANQPTLVSVIIRTKNRVDFLAKAVASVITQSHRPLELVVVNDGGADINNELRNWLADIEDIKLCYVHNKTSLGRSNAANNGLHSASGQLSIFLDDDDYFDADHIELLLHQHEHAFSDGKSLGAVHSRARAVQLQDQEEHLLSIQGYAFEPSRLYYQNMLPILTVLFPTQVRELGVSFDPEFDLFEDWDFWLQLSKVCSFSFLDHVSCTYLIHDAGSGVRDHTRQHLAFEQIYLKWLPSISEQALRQLLVQSHDWREDTIAQVQAQHNQALNRIGAQHTLALDTIATKDKDIAHLTRIYLEMEQAVKDEREQVTQLDRQLIELQASHHDLQQQFQLLAQEHTLILHDLKITRMTSAFYIMKCLYQFVRAKTTNFLARNTEEHMNHPIDVIVPVYRGLKDVIDCLDSIKASNNTLPFELILIDDCSPEPAVSQLLKDRAAMGEFTLLVNEQNLGFVATVNRGMQLHPERDVLLLNSDTIVANDWLDRITKAAYTHQRIGTVTPFSNNATICSYPEFCQDNRLAGNTPLALLDQLFAEANSGKSVDVPTGVGFCMYIRRACLDEVGYFDVETFGKGYGEENDFCQRALKAGWANRFALDTFVQHTGNVSFGDEHNELKHTALGKLLKRHPSYDVDVQRHIAEDPAKNARIRTWLASLRFGTQPILIHVSHSRGGGTARFVEELSQTLSTQCYSLLLTASLKKPGYLVLTRVVPTVDGLATEESEYSLYFEAHGHQELLQDVLSQLPLAGFHFHHMVGLPDWLMSVPTNLNQPWMVTLHDYYYLDDSISLTNDQGVYLEGDALTIDWSWIQKFEDLLNGAKVCLAPSEACRTLYASQFPNANLITQYHEKGRHLDHANYPVNAIDAKQNSPLKVVVVGALSKIKGADALENLAQHCAKQGLNIEFELIGYGYRELQGKPKANLTVSGRYQESQLVDLLKQRHADGQADLVWFTAQWPETYSYTLSATIEAGLPVLVPNIGAFAERVYQRPNSWVMPWQSKTSDIANVLLNLVKEGSQHEALSAFVSKVAPATQAFDYNADYLNHLRDGKEAVNLNNWSSHSLLVWLSQTQPLTNTNLSAQQKIRRKALYTLFRLRQAPLMRTIAKRVPLSLQRRIRDKLMR